MLKTSIAVSASTPYLEAEAKMLAEQLHLPFAQTDTSYDYLLLLTPHYLGLTQPGEPALPIYVDFLSGKMAYRRQQATVRNELLARALGLKANTKPTIVDATAGLARDSFILACLGFEVQLIERSPIIYALVQDGIQRALKNKKIAPMVKRLQLYNEDAISYLHHMTEKPEIIYLDPMFPERNKSALVKKEMRIFHRIVGDDQDAPALLQAALACATKRVVVKRPRLANSLAGRAPSYSLKGSSSRFDIYLK